MKSGIPWNLKRVDEETRRAVIDAARRQGLSVGEWLNQVLAEEGEGYAEPEGIDPGAGEATDAPGDLATAISQIRSRLKQIEESVAQSAERHRPVADRRRSPKSVQEMIADLAREIENPDARARSTVEGPGARSPAPPAEPDVGRVNDAIRDLDRKIAAMGRRIAEPPPEDVKPARLDDIRYHLNALLARAPTPARSRPSPELPLPQAVLIDAALRALESRIDDAKAQLDARAGDASATAEQIARVEARLAEIGNRLAATNDERQRPRKEADLASAIREISSHQRAIDDRAETLAMRRDQKALAAAMAALRADIATLGEQVNAITRVGAEEHGAIFDIARRIDALAADSPLDRNLLAAIRDDLETMRATIDGSARQSTLGNVEERSDRVAAQINDLLTRTPDRARIETLGEEVAQLRRALEADDSPRAIQRLEMRVAELGRAIEAALSARQAPPQSDPALERLETRLQEIAGRIEVLRDNGTQAAAIATAERRLEGRLADIAGRLGGLVDTTSHSVAIEAAQRQLEGRLEEVVAHLGGMLATVPRQAALETLHERLQGVSERIDRLSAAQREPTAALDAIKGEIATLRAEVAGRPEPTPASTEHLEAQIRDLAAQLETVASSNAEGEALALLEAQVARLANELEQTKPRVAALANVEESLGRVQTLLADTTRESVASARAEARKAVSELSDLVAGNDIDSELVRGLMRDLENLKSAAGSSDASTRLKLESVSGTLTGVVDRLSRLENEANKVAGRTTAAAYGMEAAAGAGRAASAWTASFKAAAGLTPARKPDQPSTERKIQAGTTDVVLPVAPPEKTAADQRADFIAAARRAAQAAAARVAAGEMSASSRVAPPVEKPAGPTGATSETRPGAFARISQAIRNRKRPLLLAAAAIVLAVAAMQVYGKLPMPREEESLISAADAVPQKSASQFRNVAAAALPTMPRVAEDALVPPAATPDAAIAFAKPENLDGRFDINPNAPKASGFAVDDGSLDEPALDGGVTLASAGADAPAMPPGAASGLDPRLGSQKLLGAADAGDPAAAFEIATRYAEGTLLPKDLSKATDWYRRAAEGGVAVAQYRLGSLYERGQGVPTDLVSATNWYQRAADQGNVNAMHNLAVLMSEGVEGTPDHDKALQWFLAAGNYGVRDSQYNLGVIFARGLGPAQDLPESYKWFAIAAAQGDSDAATRRDEVAKVLKPDELAKAKAAVASWHVKPPLAEANGVSAPGGGWDGPGEALAEADRQALVRKIQTLLAEQGYDPGPADGMLGPKTVEAVRAYQRKLGQAETGQIDNTLVAALADRAI